MIAKSNEGAQPFEQFLETCSQEYKKTLSELKEIDLLIQQTSKEVERMARRNTQATNQLRLAESSIETVPRQDLKEAYSAVLDTQQRLFTMQGQLEKLQSDQRNMARYLDILRSVLEQGHHPDRPRPPEPEEEELAPQAAVVRVIEAQERERRRLSRQMHDGPAQSLTNLILQAEICERLMDVNPEQARVELANLKSSVADTFQKVKGFILNLRPMMLDDLGLVPTLRRYLDSFSDSSDMVTDISVMGKERRLASHSEVTTFRVIQELLHNARDVGRASSARIMLDMRGDDLQVTFEDDGDGLDLGDALSSEEAEKLGLTTMRERIEMLGGEIHFENARGGGTRVTFTLPAS